MSVGYLTSLIPSVQLFDAGGEEKLIAFDAGSGSGRILKVCITWKDAGVRNIDYVRYNGVDLTADGVKVAVGSQAARAYTLLGTNPASGSNNIAVGMGAGGADAEALVGAWVGDGSDQTISGYASNSGTGSSANIVSSVTVSSAINKRVVVWHATGNADGNIHATATNYTERQDTDNGNATTLQFGDAAGASSIATSATWDNGAFAVDWIALGSSVNEISDSSVQWMPSVRVVRGQTFQPTVSGSIPGLKVE